MSTNQTLNLTRLASLLLLLLTLASSVEGKTKSTTTTKLAKGALIGIVVAAGMDHPVTSSALLLQAS